MAKSIIQANRECWMCRRLYNLRTTKGLEVHHVICGRGRRALSEQYGLTVYLCPLHHRTGNYAVHKNLPARMCLQRRAQRAFEARYGHEAWMQHFGADYLSDYRRAQREFEEHYGHEAWMQQYGVDYLHGGDDCVI